MIENKTETMDEYLNRELSGKKNKTKKSSKVKDKKVKSKNKKKGLAVRLVAFVLAVITVSSAFATGLASLLFRNKNKNNVPTTSKDSIISTVDLDDMGQTLDFPENEATPVYGVTTGDINKDELTVSKDPKTGKTTIWKNEQAKDNSKDIGNVTTDTKGGTLTVTSDGKVKQNGQGYQVKDEKTGTVISSGNGSAPEGKVWDSEVSAYVDPSELGKYVICTKDYKDPETGNIIFAKGDQVDKNTLGRIEAYIKNYDIIKSSQSTVSQSTTSSSTSSETKTTTQSTTTSKETVSSGKYTINGLTFKSKADYDQWVIQGFEGYDLVDGIMMSEQERLEYQKTLNR